ncbi:MAG TPA: helix-turn-helix domain-containing protein [Candidatus Eisenbacteria bacterium]
MAVRRAPKPSLATLAPPRPARGSRTPRWRRRKAARPAEILDAALATFVEGGYAATRIEEIARRAGVSKGTMYLYFRNKEALFRAVVAHSMVPMVERGEEIARAHRGSSRDLLSSILLTWWDSLEASPASGLTKLMVAEARNFPGPTRLFVKEVFLRRRRLLTRVIRRGIRNGEFRRVRPELAVRLAIAPILLASIWKHSFQQRESQPLDLRALVRLHAETFLRGIAK